MTIQMAQLRCKGPSRLEPSHPFRPPWVSVPYWRAGPRRSRQLTASDQPLVAQQTIASLHTPSPLVRKSAATCVTNPSSSIPQRTAPRTSHERPPPLILPIPTSCRACRTVQTTEKSLNRFNTSTSGTLQFSPIVSSARWNGSSDRTSWQIGRRGDVEGGRRSDALRKRFTNELVVYQTQCRGKEGRFAGCHPLNVVRQ